MPTRPPCAVNLSGRDATLKAGATATGLAGSFDCHDVQGFDSTG
ncbi:hypothetical protein ABZ901_20075 [Actinacidiphila alni]